jgi:hypothetical protein
MKRYERWMLRALVTIIYIIAFALAVVAQMSAPERSWSILALTLSYGFLMLLIWLHDRYPSPDATKDG